jgi:hypothetical protein
MDWGKVGIAFLTVIQVSCFFCAIYIFFRFAQRTSPLRRLQNHVLMCLLVIATWSMSIELPNTQKYFWSGSATIQTSWFCIFWNISFFSTAILNRVLMAFMCIERHFLVFRPQLYHTHRSRLLFHYIPLFFVISVFFIYIFVTNVFITCSRSPFDYSRFMCGYTCGVLSAQLGLVFTWICVFAPTAITIIGCVLLPIRFIIQKRQLQQVQWHRARKMIVQTTIIAGAYSICWLPYAIILQLTLNYLLSFFNPDVNRFFAFVPYMTSLLTPFIALHIISGRPNLRLMEEIKRRFFPQRQGAIQPAVDVILQQQNPSALEECLSTIRIKAIQN